MTNHDGFMRAIALENVKEFASKNIYARGERYFRENRVEMVSQQWNHLHLHVRGSRGAQYCVDITQLDEEIFYDCNCPGNASFDICKHIVASLFFIDKQLRDQNDPTFWQEPLNEALQLATYYPASTRKRSKQTILFLL